MMHNKTRKLETFGNIAIRMIEKFFASLMQRQWTQFCANWRLVFWQAHLKVINFAPL